MENSKDQFGDIQQSKLHQKSSTPNKSYSVPRKYDKLIHKTTIPRISIQRLIEKMDQDNDGWIKKDDILVFSKKHYLFFEDELAQAMIDEAISKRIVAFKDQLKEPINIDEVLGAVQLHYVLNQDHIWVEKSRPYRDHWIQLLLAAGEKLPSNHDLPPVKISKVLDMHEMEPFPFKPKLNSSQSQIIHTSELQEPRQFPEQQPEAGILLQETIMIKPINNGITKEQGTDNPFEKVVNSKFNNNDQQQSYPTLRFETQAYYNEAERLSKEPKLCKSSRNPIFKFMPENLNYKVDKMNSQKQSQDQNQTQQLGQTATKYLSQPVLMRKPYHGLSDTGFQTSDSKYFQPNQNKKQLHEDQNADKHIFYANVDTKEYFNKQFKYDKFTSKQEIYNYLIKQSIIQNQKQNNTFKPEDVQTLKNKLANLKQREKEKLQDFYNPPSTHKFRDDVLDKKKPLFKTRIKPDPLTNPHMMSEHDQRPQFAIEEDEKKQMREEQKQQDYIDDCMGTHKQTKQWIKYFPTADLNHNFVDHKRPNFIDKGNYQEPGLILFQFLREGASAKDDFQLFHRQLRTNDKHLYLGIQMDPNQQ